MWWQHDSGLCCQSVWLRHANFLLGWCTASNASIVVEQAQAWSRVVKTQSGGHMASGNCETDQLRQSCLMQQGHNRLATLSPADKPTRPAAAHTATHLLNWLPVTLTLQAVVMMTWKWQADPCSTRISNSDFLDCNHEDMTMTGWSLQHDKLAFSHECECYSHQYKNQWI